MVIDRLKLITMCAVTNTLNNKFYSTNGVLWTNNPQNDIVVTFVHFPVLRMGMLWIQSWDLCDMLLQRLQLQVLAQNANGFMRDYLFLGQKKTIEFPRRVCLSQNKLTLLKENKITWLIWGFHNSRLTGRIQQKIL